RRNDRRHVQVAVARGWRSDAHGLVGEPHVHRRSVGGRMDRNRLDPHLPARAVNPQRDLTAVGDQDLLKHLVITALFRGEREMPISPPILCRTRSRFSMRWPLQKRITRYPCRPISATRPYSISIRTVPYSTGCASVTRICVTRPGRWARIWFMTFIAS